MRRDVGWADEAARKAGRDPTALAFAQLQNTFVWDDADTAWEIASKYVPNQLGIYGGWAAGGDTPDQGFLLDPPDEETLRRLTPTGDPQGVIHALRPLVEAFGSRREFHLIVRLHYPGMDFETASHAMELFAARVLPGLKGD
jgi:alkanesulfonate monooxygenase SsuD/methylene tetrahydromethanopterin reductase-like flavin-dependent oxidoreductase (luciferase family)